MRGNRHRAQDARQIRNGSIPAHAGEPARIRSSTLRSRVYPRACGGTPEWWEAVVVTVYPRACGGTLILNVPAPSGSIPAHAGEPSYTVLAPLDCHTGLSPRMRGNRLGESTSQKYVHQGSIPAHAGEPAARLPRTRGTAGVYPRACGGTRCARSAIPTVTLPGSIPAHAGEPGSTASTGRTASRVYPRACGGTGRDRHRPFVIKGLSPRMRGNRDGDQRAPASDPNRVYPRACGGTPKSSW